MCTLTDASLHSVKAVHGTVHPSVDYEYVVSYKLSLFQRIIVSSVKDWSHNNIVNTVNVS